MSLFVLFCVGLISLIILGVTYVLGSTMDDNCVGAWLFTSIGFGICLTILLYQNGILSL